MMDNETKVLTMLKAINNHLGEILIDYDKTDYRYKSALEAHQKAWALVAMEVEK